MTVIFNLASQTGELPIAENHSSEPITSKTSPSSSSNIERNHARFRAVWSWFCAFLLSESGPYMNHNVFPINRKIIKRCNLRSIVSCPQILQIQGVNGATGHLLGAAGAVEALFSILSIHHVPHFVVLFSTLSGVGERLEFGVGFLYSDFERFLVFIVLSLLVIRWVFLFAILGSFSVVSDTSVLVATFWISLGGSQPLNVHFHLLHSGFLCCEAWRFRRLSSSTLTHICLS